MLPLTLHFLLIVNAPIPDLDFGVKFPLKDKVCPLLILAVLVLADNIVQLPLSIQYSHALTLNFAVNHLLMLQ